MSLNMLVETTGGFDYTGRVPEVDGGGGLHVEWGAAFGGAESMVVGRK
ncbi:hypothetical protein [Streptomyces eurocidicus]